MTKFKWPSWIKTFHLFPISKLGTSMQGPIEIINTGLDFCGHVCPVIVSFKRFYK